MGRPILLNYAPQERLFVCQQGGEIQRGEEIKAEGELQARGASPLYIVGIKHLPIALSCDLLINPYRFERFDLCPGGLNPAISSQAACADQYRRLFLLVHEHAALPFAHKLQRSTSIMPFLASS